MKKILLTIPLCLTSVFNAYAIEPLELSKMTCFDFISEVAEIKESKNGKIKMASLSSFLYGYAAAEQSNVVFNLQELKKVLQEVKTTCMSDDEQNIIEALKIAYKKAKAE